MTREEYLKHHGILGQKWGHRAGPPYPLGPSDHTAAEKKAGYTNSLAKKHAETWKKYRNDNFDESPGNVMRKHFVKGANDYDEIAKSLEGHKNNILKCEKEAEKLLDNDDLNNSDKYTALAAVASDFYYNDSLHNNNMESLSQNIWFYSCEDGDQGIINSTFCYLKENNLKDSALDIYKRSENYKKEYLNECENKVNKLLGEYGNESVNSKSIYAPSVSKSISERMLSSNMKLYDDINVWILGEGCDGFVGTDGAKASRINSAVSKAKKIVSKIDFDNGSADKLLNAVNTLNYNDIKVSDMTDDMWKAINDEMRK